MGGGGGGGGGGTDAGTGTGNVSKALCTAHFAITGTFTLGTTPRPTDPDTNVPLDGCWPVGQWDFTATVTSDLEDMETACATAPTVLAKYSFKVEMVATTNPDDDPQDLAQKVTNLTSMGDMVSHVAVSSNGQGCEGSMEVGSADGKKLWNLQPTLSKDPAVRTLAGKGDYSEYKADAWPWKDTSS